MIQERHQKVPHHRGEYLGARMMAPDTSMSENTALPGIGPCHSTDNARGWRTRMHCYGGLSLPDAKNHICSTSAAADLSLDSEEVRQSRRRAICGVNMPVELCANLTLKAQAGSVMPTWRAQSSPTKTMAFLTRLKSSMLRSSSEARFCRTSSRSTRLSMYKKVSAKRVRRS